MMASPFKFRVRIKASRSSAGQAADGLVDHGLEDGGRQVLPGGPLVDQRLDIGFCKYTAPGRNGIDGLVIFGVFVEACGVGL